MKVQSFCLLPLLLLHISWPGIMCHTYQFNIKSKLYARAKLTIDKLTAVKIGHVHYQKTNNVGSGTRSGISPPLQAGLECLTHTRSRLSVNTNIRHSNEGLLTAVKLEHPQTIITWLYRGLISLPIEVTFSFKFSAILFDHGLNSVFWAKLHNLENLSILENLAVTWRYTDRPTFRPSAPQAYQC